jgi:hypothetical protein
MNSLPQLNSASSLPSQLATQNKPLSKMSGAMAPMMHALAKGGELMQQRVDDLGKATTQLAGDLIGQFAQALFGDQAKGMTLQMDEMSLSVESNFTAISQQSAQGSASAFRLSDTSHFSGKGTLTTADGQRFDIEIDIRYESLIEGASIARQGNNSNAAKAIPNDTNAPSNVIDVLDASPVDDAPATPSAATPPTAPATQPASQPAPVKDAAPTPFSQYFSGTALDLLQRLTSEPVFQPFALLKPAKEGQDALKLLGNMSLQLLNLPGGPRHVDLSPNGDAHKKALDTSV